MDDLIGIGKLADSKLINSAYEDGAQPAMREGGLAARDIAKSFRLFLAPFQFAAVAQDRLAAFCDRIRNSVPPERQIDAPASIAGPVLLSLQFMEDGNPVTELFVTLLERCIDRDRADEVHPAYLKIIEQMCPDEAMIMYSLREESPLCILPSIQQYNTFPFYRVANEDRLPFNCQHLEMLGLTKCFTPSFVALTQFGEEFARVCVPAALPGIIPIDYAERLADHATR